MTYGVIDIGSNTIRLSIYDVTDGKIKPLLNNKNTAGLAGYVVDGELSKKGIRKACQVLEEQIFMAEQTQVSQVFAFATASLRNISNTEEALAIIKEKTAVDVEVLPGLEEARLDFVGASHAQKLDSGLMVDIGGGSTELVAIENGEIKDACSIGVGSLNMYKQYVSELFPEDSERKDIIKRTKSELKGIGSLGTGKFNTMIGIGGTIRAMKKYNNEYFDYPITNDIISKENLITLTDELNDDNRKLLKKILRVAPDRIHTLIPGLMILNTIYKEYGCRDIVMSRFGLREGYLYEKVAGRK